MSEWIKCSEMLPDLPRGGKHHVIGYTPAKDAQRFANGSRFLYWNGIDWRYPDGTRFEHRVTHWQPFLTPPTAQPAPGGNHERSSKGVASDGRASNTVHAR